MIANDSGAKAPFFISWVGLTAALFLAACSAAPAPASGTATAVVALKATAQAETSLTQAAAPSPTSTATLPPGAPDCRAAGLSATAPGQGATGALAIALRVTNAGQETCALQNTPDARLVDAAGRPLPVTYRLVCMGCLPPPAEGAATPDAPLQTLAAQSTLGGRIGLAPGESATALLVWRNWCEAPPVDGVTVRLVLPGAAGSLDALLEAGAVPRCDAPGEPATLVISQFERLAPPQ